MKTNKQHSEQKLLLIKACIITVFILLMLIPISWLKSMINERKSTTEHMVKDVGKQWGESQTFRGLIMVLPVLNQTNTIISYAYFLPEEFNVTGDIKPVKVSKGIVDALCYQSTLDISGTFKFPDIAKLGLSENQVAWDKAFMILNLSSLNSIRNKIDFTIDDKSLDLVSDTKTTGLTAGFPLDPQDQNKTYNFKLNLGLNGMDSLTILPAGRHATIDLKSTWNSVDFVGDFLPDNKDGFPAKWEFFDYNRSFPQMWLDKDIKEFDKNVVGVNLLIPIGDYQKILRSVKYAILFIVLTFTIFFLIEVLTKKRIHPIQYLLVSFALVMFYTLLLAFSEHLGYDISYLIAALCVITMITAYSKSVLQNKKQVISIFIFLCALYLYLYMVVQSEDMALLFGSIGLFVMLAAVMYVSRNVDWYAMKEPKEKDLKKESEFKTYTERKEDVKVDKYEIEKFHLDQKIDGQVIDKSKDQDPKQRI